MRGSRGDLPYAYARAVIHLPCAVHLLCAAAEESGARETAGATAAGATAAGLLGQRLRGQRFAGLRGLRPWGCGGNGRGAAGAAAGTSAGWTSAAGALDAGWTLWMRQNRAPRLAVNAYIRCLISSRDEHVDDIYSRYSNVII